MTCQMDVKEDFIPAKEIKQYSFGFIMMKYLFGCRTFQHNNLFINKKNVEFTHKHLREMLSDIHNLFVEGNVRYLICSGTLLGAYREGDFIKGDSDIDMRVDEDDWDRCLELLQHLNEKYIIKKVNDKYYRVDSRLKLPGEPFHVDVVSSYREHDTYSWDDVEWPNVDYMFDKQLDTINISGLEVYGPNKDDIVPYLEMNYGKKWNVKMCHNFKHKNWIILANVIFLVIVGIFVFLSVRISKFFYIPAVILFIMVVISLINN